MTRYAVYFAPLPRSPLAAFGRAVLGWDAETGEAGGTWNPGLLEAFPDWPMMVSEPARYGFHATLKAPFGLKETCSEADLIAAVEHVAAELDPACLGALDIAPFGRFVVLLPGEAGMAAAAAVAGTVVRKLAHLDLPLSPADRERRLLPTLTERQIANLERWGYPYVLDDFKFHMTLAGPLVRESMEAVCRKLDGMYRPAREAVALDAICLFKQRSRDEGFRVVSRHWLGGDRRNDA